MSTYQSLLTHESTLISAHQSQALLRLVEAAPEVKRLPQLFSWLQSHVQVMLPHTVLSCGRYERGQRRLRYDVLPSAVLPQSLLDTLEDAQGDLIKGCSEAWAKQGGKPLVLEADAEPWLKPVRAAGLAQLCCHGVARPGRLHELESFFVFLHPEPLPADTLDYVLELLLPQLHRVLASVRAESALDGAGLGDEGVAPSAKGLLSSRELQVLAGVRAGQSNQEIGERLHISALTVKNHVQKILRKLNASNRAQAVAIALAQNLFANLEP
jgi:transcriptional regulator EpsA